MHQANGHWHQETVAGHPCDLYSPPHENRHGYVVLYLHGIHQTRLIDKVPFNQQFDHYDLPVVAPFTGRSWWVDKICPEFDPQISAERFVLERILPFLAERFGSKPPQIALLGTSMGGQGALRLAYKYPNLFPIAAAIAPAIDFQRKFNDGDVSIPAMYPDPESARQDTALLHIHPLNWPRNQFFCCDPADLKWWDSADRLRMKLASLGIPFEYDLETSGGGHDFAYYNLMAEKAVGFLARSLDKERRRVV